MPGQSHGFDMANGQVIQPLHARVKELTSQVKVWATARIYPLPLVNEELEPKITKFFNASSKANSWQGLF